MLDRHFKRLVKMISDKVNNLLQQRSLGNIKCVYGIMHKRKPIYQLGIFYMVIIFRLVEDVLHVIYKKPVTSPPLWMEFSASVVSLLIFLIWCTTSTRRSKTIQLIGLIICGYIPWCYTVYCYVIYLQVYLLQELDIYHKIYWIESLMWKSWFHFLFEALRFHFITINVSWKVLNRAKPRGGRRRRR